jgi:hypothetical protein
VRCRKSQPIEVQFAVQYQEAVNVHRIQTVEADSVEQDRRILALVVEVPNAMRGSNCEESFYCVAR